MATQTEKNAEFEARLTELEIAVGLKRSTRASVMDGPQAEGERVRELKRREAFNRG
jgi:hypothetical protein